jgi:hypothetical protein
MKKDKRKAFWKTRMGKALMAGVLAISISLLSNSSARAGLLDDLKQLSSNIQNVFKQFNTLSEQLATNITNYTNIATSEVQSLLGEFGQFDPEKLTQKAISSQNSKNYYNDVLATGRAVTSSLSNRVLSQEAQKSAADLQKQNAALNDKTIAKADEVFFQGEDAQVLDSSQQILKKLSRQLSGQADISTSLVQMSVLNATDNQELKMQAAATNQGLAKSLEQQQGENQRKFLRGMSDSSYFTKKTSQNLLLDK